MQKTVLIINPDREERDRLCRSLGADPACRVIGLAQCSDALKMADDRDAPDVLLVEPAALGGDSGLRALADLRRRWDGTRMVAFADDSGRAHAVGGGIETLPRPDSLLKLRSLVASLGGRSSAGTAAAARLPGFEGYLEGIPLADLVQILCVTYRTGRLRLQSAEGGGQLCFVRGDIVHAADEQGDGEEALYRLVATGSGRFGFDDGATPRRRTIASGWEHLLMEALRRQDESMAAEPAPDRAAEPEPEGAAQVEADLVGRHVGPYQLTRTGRHRPDGVLYEALNPALREHLHVFVLDPGMARDPMRVVRFLERAQKLAGAAHPNVVRTIAAGEAEGIAYCVEEHVDGISVAGRIEQERHLDAGQTMAVFRDCVRGLSRLHADGLGHGRITPDTIVLGKEGVTRLGGLNGLAPEESSARDDVAALASALRAALRPADRDGTVDMFLRDLEGSQQDWDALDELLEMQPGRSDPPAPVSPAPPRRAKLRLPWSRIAVELAALAAVVYWAARTFGRLS